MLPKKYVIRLLGYSCVGKSTIERLIMEKIPGIYSVFYDSLKWNLSGYNRDKDIALINKIELGFFEVVCQKGIPILLSAYIRTEEDYNEYKNIAEKYGYYFLEAEITAPKDVLLSRFRARIKDNESVGNKISVTDESVFLNNLSKPFFIPKNVITYDTSIMEASDIADKICELIKSKQ
jgi:hypothetical protein